MNKEPSVLTRMRLSCCWGDNLNEKELNEVVDYINYLQQENQQLKDRISKAIEYINDLLLDFYDYECEQLIVGKYMINELLETLKGNNKED